MQLDPDNPNQRGLPDGRNCGCAASPVLAAENVGFLHASYSPGAEVVPPAALNRTFGSVATGPPTSSMKPDGGGSAMSR